MDVHHPLKLINYARILFVSVRLTVSKVNLDSLCTLSVFLYFHKGKYLSQISPGACFSKVPIINGPGKLSPFSLKIEVSIVLHVI